MTYRLRRGRGSLAGSAGAEHYRKRDDPDDYA
jgi:hypothetical protein